jgi:hypothetical protein
MVFDHIIVDVGTVGAALGSGLNINYRHARSPYLLASQHR